MEPSCREFLSKRETITRLEALVLWRIADISEDVFDLFEDLIDPIGELVIWAAFL